MQEFIRLWKLLYPYRFWMLGGALISLVTLLANIILMATAGWFLAALANAGLTNISINYFTPAVLVRSSALLRAAGRYGERIITHEATLRLIAGLRVWFYRHLEPLAPARTQDYHSGDLLSRLRADIDALDTLYLRVLVPVAVAAISALLCTIFWWIYNPLIALNGFCFLLLAGVVMPVWAQRRGKLPGQRIASGEGELRTAIIDGIQGMAELTLYGAASRQAMIVDQLSRNLLKEQAQLSNDHGLTQAAVGLSMNLSLWCLFWLAIPVIRDGQMPPPHLAMLTLFTLASFEAVAPLPHAFQAWGRTLAAARRIFSIIDLEPAIREPSQLIDIQSNFSNGCEIEFDQVSFQYPKARQWALHEFSLKIPAGSKIAIVGATGAGKTTILNLILRFWELNSGAIRINGQVISAIHSEDLRRQIAVVSQHTYLFNTSIRENLLLADPAAMQDDLENACRVAQIHDFIVQLPDGYDTWVGETGVRLSGGQGRRLAIARALLKNAPILLLDEPTEGLDSNTERDFMRSLDQLMKNRTVLLITHRPAGLQWVDKILLLDQGHIINSSDNIKNYLI